MELRCMTITELREKLKEIGIITENQNMFQLFEQTTQPTYKERVFEGNDWKLIISGRLGQPHKDLLEIILCKKYVYDFIKINNNERLEVLYNENKIKRYMLGILEYSYERYKELLNDMMQTVIELKTKELSLRRLEGFVSGTITLKDFEPPQKMSSIIPEKVTLTTIDFGTMATIFIENEFKLSYKQRQFGLINEIYQEIIKAMSKTFYEELSKFFTSFEEDRPMYA